MKSNNARSEKYCCDSQPKTGPCQSVQINPSCPGLHWHPLTHDAQGRVTFPWVSLAMEKGRRREKNLQQRWGISKRGNCFPAKEIASALNALWLIQPGAKSSCAEAE